MALVCTIVGASSHSSAGHGTLSHRASLIKSRHITSFLLVGFFVIL